MLGRGLPALSILFDILNIHIGQSSWILSSLCSWVRATFEANKKEKAHIRATINLFSLIRLATLENKNKYIIRAENYKNLSTTY